MSQPSIRIPDRARPEPDADRWSAPAPSLDAYIRLSKESSVERLVEADALESDASRLERAGSIELANFVDVLGRDVLAVRDRFFHESLSSLCGGRDPPERYRVATHSACVQVTTLDIPRKAVEPTPEAQCRVI